LRDTNSKQTKQECLDLGRRFERKFFVQPGNINLALMLLKQLCRPDREYPNGLVNSLYFDTPDLEMYFQSESGDYRKKKVRIRWYGAWGYHQDERPVYLELKMREGFVTHKRRVSLTVPAGRLEHSQVGSGIIARPLLMEKLAALGIYPSSPLQPVIVISYQRHRFTEMLTGTRLCLDQNIRSYMVSPGLGYVEPELLLEGGVIELKGTGSELPVSLRRVKMLGTDWTRFSKYGNCLEAHLMSPGSAGRLWPAGRMAVG